MRYKAFQYRKAGQSVFWKKGRPAAGDNKEDGR